MKCSVSHGPARNRASLSARLHVLAAIAGLSLPLLAGCPGALEGNWPPAGAVGTGTGGMTGTGGSGPGTGGTMGGCDAPTMWLTATTPANVGCASPGACHGGVFNPDFTKGDPWTTLQGNAMLGTGCVGQPLVNPSKPASGVLIKRLTGMECGFPMPFPSGGNQAAIDCITSWVNSKLP